MWVELSPWRIAACMQQAVGRIMGCTISSSVWNSLRAACMRNQKSSLEPEMYYMFTKCCVARQDILPAS
jgi:hypothetical protein